MLAASGTSSCPKTGSAALCGLSPIVAQYPAEAFVASDRSLACLPERQRDDVVEALVIALVVIVLKRPQMSSVSGRILNAERSGSRREDVPGVLPEVATAVDAPTATRRTGGAFAAVF